MPALERFDGREAIDWSAVWAAFERDGGLLVEHFIAPDLLARLQHRSGVTMPSATVPGWLAEAAALVDEGILSRLTNRPPKAPLTGVRLARRPVSFDLAKANELLPERRHTLNQTLSDLFAWFEAEGLWRRD